MASYEALKNKYEYVLSRADYLQEQLDKKNADWGKREEEFKVKEKNMRELCESILAKDKKEMILGQDYSWDSVPTLELISKSKRVFKEYNDERTHLMKTIMEQSEERRQTIESLEDQLAMSLSSPGSVEMTREQLEKQVQKEKAQEEILKRGNANVRSKVESGSINYTMGEDSDYVSDEEAENMADAIDTNAAIKVMNNSIPHNDARTQVEFKKEKRREAAKKHMVDLAEWEEKFTEEDWMFILTIGGQGISEYPRIESYILGKNPTSSKTKLRSASNNLDVMGVVKKERVSTPVSQVMVFRLTSLGKRLYEAKAKKKAVLSEMDIILSEHDNAKHGYGIRYIADAIRKTGDFKDVCDENRKSPINVSEGVKYIPDIICTEANGTKRYIEYEVGTTAQVSFNAKCNKMAKITKSLYYVGPNDKEVQVTVEKIKKWITNRGAASLVHVTVYATSANRIMGGASILEDDTWKYIFRPETAKPPEEPEIH